MRIKSVYIKNYGPLETGRWDIDISRSLILLCGPHGSGKTTFLKSIEHCLSRNFGRNLSSPLPPYLLPYDKELLRSESFSVELELSSTNLKDKNFLNSENRILKFPEVSSLEDNRFNEFGPRVPFGFISSEDYIPRTGFTFCKFYFHAYSSSELLWIKKPETPLNSVEMLAASIKFMRDNNINYNDIITAINYCISKVVNLEFVIDDSGLYCRRASDTEDRKLYFLSDAEYYAVAVSLFAFIFLPPSGILILDSPETHLSPASQYNLLSSILPRFKDGQVIVATHSPSLIASRMNQEIYVLERSQGIQMPMKAECDKAMGIIKELYGCEVSKSVLDVLSENSSSQVLTYLLECSIIPEAISRRSGDPQIQQLAAMLSGQLTRKDQGRKILLDIGAGKGDLLKAIHASGCAEKLTYIPVEPKIEFWEIIKDRAQKIPGLNYIEPQEYMSNIEKADLIFFVNVIHELDLHKRIELINEAFRLLYPDGALIVHEVAVLPKGELDFVVWSGDDLKLILENANIDPKKITITRTRTRPGGWPLEFTTILVDVVPDQRKLREAAIESLHDILSHWTQKLMENDYEEMDPELRDRLRAFRMAQVANLCVWIKKYGNSQKIL
jgi:SAM-dependent methyltransferase